MYDLTTRINENAELAAVDIEGHWGESRGGTVPVLAMTATNAFVTTDHTFIAEVVMANYVAANG